MGEFLVSAAEGLLRNTLLVSHLLVNCLAGSGPLLCALGRLITQRSDASDAALERLARWSLVALGVGLMLGLASAGMLWLSPTSAYRHAAARAPLSAYGFLAAEWCFTAALYVVYVATWRRLAGRPWLHGLIALVGATNLLYHFPTIMIVMGALATDPNLLSDEPLTRDAFRRLIVRPELLGKTIHVWAASVVVAGIAAATAGARPFRASNAGNPLALLGGGAAIGGLVVSFLSGVATLYQLDVGVQRALVGENPLATAALGGGVLATIALGHTLVATALGAARSRHLLHAALLTAVVFATMTIARHVALEL